MKRVSSALNSSSVRWLGWVFVSVILAMFFWFAVRSRREDQPVPANATLAKAFSPTNSTTAARYAWFRERPLNVSQESNAHQWTAGDGKSPEIIRQLAHNELEYDRMLKENDTIYRRQLVYRKQTMSALAQHALQSGEPIRELLVPGLDGEEYQVEVRDVELADGGTNGTFSGNIIGRPDSMVTMAFRGGREAFTVVSTAENIFIAAEPREPGEVVVKKIDPDKYGGLDHPCTVN